MLKFLLSDILWTPKNIWLETFLTQNMQDRQTQVRAGPARAVGKLRETDGMVTDRSDAAAGAAAGAATDQWASLSLIQEEEE